MRLEHDPESGCDLCPFRTVAIHTVTGPHDACSVGALREVHPRAHPTVPADDWCPLRMGAVVVSAPEQPPPKMWACVRCGGWASQSISGLVCHDPDCHSSG